MKYCIILGVVYLLCLGMTACSRNPSGTDIASEIESNKTEENQEENNNKTKERTKVLTDFNQGEKLSLCFAEPDDTINDMIQTVYEEGTITIIPKTIQEAKTIWT